jgi:putative hemolysin
MMQRPPALAAPCPRTDARPCAFPSEVPELREGRYRVRFAQSRADLEQALRLRFEVFNRELGEGLAESWRTGLDADPFDALCHHLLLVDGRHDEIVGTYRLQTAEMARGLGFYCAGEFELAGMEPLLRHAVELGRACIRREHRHGSALFALWRGLAAYMAWCRKGMLFGCCSLTSQNPHEGVALLAQLERDGHVDERLRVPVQPSHACSVAPGIPLPRVKLPALFGTYLRHGAKVLGGPAIDREFGTIDYLVALDLARMPARLRRFFFAGLADPLLADGGGAQRLALAPEPAHG